MKYCLSIYINKKVHSQKNGSIPLGKQVLSKFLTSVFPFTLSMVKRWMSCSASAEALLSPTP
jgi:hypothetical protein